MAKKEKTRTEKHSAKLFAAFGDKVKRFFVSSVLSLLTTALFAGYNLFLWMVGGAAWNIGIAVYYLLLAAIRAHVLLSERKFRRSELPEAERETARSKLFLVHSVLLFLLDLALIAPISLMVMQKKAVSYSQIPAIATAAYTTYKIAISTRNFIKDRKARHLSVKTLRTLNFVDALVSLLSLQYVLVMTFGEGVTDKMLTLCATTSFAVWVLLLAVSALSLWKAIAERRKLLS